MKKIGLIGFGRIGRYLYEHLKGKYQIEFIFDSNPPEDQEAAKLHIADKEDLFSACQGADLVVETAGPQLLIEVAPEILKYADMTGFSLTAFADDSFLAQVKRACAQHGHHFYVPHGVAAGFDGVFDGRKILQGVRITTTKRPEDLGCTERSKTVIYEGAAWGACALFPRDTDVHAGLALAGIGFEETSSKIVSDPNASGITHDIEVVSDGCIFKMHILIPPDNGFINTYTPVSACSSVDKILTKEELIIV